MAATRTLNVYLPDALYREIEREARKTGKSKGGIVRDRLTGEPPAAAVGGSAIADLFGVADDLPADLSSKNDRQFPHYGQDGLR
jgi:hypothetical protein